MIATAHELQSQASIRALVPYEGWFHSWSSFLSSMPFSESLEAKSLQLSDKEE